MAKRKLKSKVKFIFAFMIIIAIAIIAFFKLNKNLEFDVSNITKIIGKKETWPKVSTVSLVATGDGLLHNPIYKAAYNKETDTYDFREMLSEVKDIISKYDIAYYNQETLFGGRQIERFGTEENGFSSYPYFNTPSEFGDAMVDIGFNTVSLVSNHSLDCTYNTEDCVQKTYKYWENKKIVFDGLNDPNVDGNKHNIGEVKGIKYGFLNYSNTFNGIDRFMNGLEDYFDVYDEEKVAKEVAELKEKVDVVIVAMHWHKNSGEYSFVPTASNKAIANYLDSLGVDIILGTYSHCLQPFDVLENGAVVFYSLGNFISNQLDLNAYGNYHPYVGAIGALANMDITKTEYEDGTVDININNIGADLLYSWHDKNYKTYKVIPFSKMNSSYNSNYKDIYNEYSSYLTNLNKNIKIAPVNE